MYFNDILLSKNFNQTNINNLVDYINAKTAEISANKQLYEIYALNAQTPSWNLVRSYALQLAPTQQQLSVYIDYDNLLDAHLNEDYTITHEDNQYVFNQLSDVVAFFVVPQNETIVVQNGQNSYTVGQDDIAESPFGYQFIYVPAGTQVTFSDNLLISDADYFWVKKLYTAPFVQFRAFNDESVNLDDFTCVLYKRTIDESGVESTTITNLTDNSQLRTTYDIERNVSAVPPLDSRYDVLLSKLLCGTTDSIQGSTIRLGKYFFELENNVLNRYTYAVSDENIIKTEEQPTGYNVCKPMSDMTKLPTRKSLVIPLNMCSVKDNRLKLLLGSNHTVVELNPKRSVSQVDVQAYAGNRNINIQNAFVLLGISKTAIQAVYFENIHAMPKSYRFNFTPNKLYLLGNLSGFGVNKGATQTLFVEQPATQLVLVNLTPSRVLTLVKDDGEQLILGGQQESIVQILQLPAFEHYRVMVQNNADDDQIVFQLLIENHKLSTPPIQLQHGYAYSVSVKDKDGNAKTDISVSLPITDYNYYCQNAKAVWTLEQQELGEFNLDDYVEISQEQIDQQNDQAVFVVAKQRKTIFDIVATLKPAKPFYNFINILDRRRLYEL